MDRFSHLKMVAISLVFIGQCLSIPAVASTTKQQPAAKTRLIVFVHGYTGDLETWTKFKALISEDRDLDDYELYSFSYPTSMLLSWNNRPIRQIGNLLGTELNERFAKYKEIYLIGHSMGGLVICSTVIEQLKAGKASNLKTIKHIVLFGTPNNGKQIPKLFRMLDKQLDGLSPTDETVEEIRNEWINRVYNPKIQPGDANSKLAIPVTVVIGLDDDIVDESSARSFFRDPEPVTVPGTHRSMKEPPDRNAIAYIVVKNRVLGRQRPGYTTLTDEQMRVTDPMIDLVVGKPFGSRTLITLQNSGVLPVVDAAVNLRCFYLKAKDDPQPV
jgi:Putative serine esterase (DUF676)